MYFNARLEIDPSQLTLIKKVKPAQLFARLLHFMSLGQLSDKQEHETFTAIAVIQQLNMGLRSVKIKNIIRLAVDEYDFYVDEKGVENDLEQAMFEFKAKVDPMESELFNKIFLVLEHIDDSIKYLIEISVTRKHKVGEYPIRINVNGVFSEFELQEGETPQHLNERMETIFKSQKAYNEFLAAKQAVFNLFVDELEKAVLKFIRVDHIIKTISSQIIRPKNEKKDLDEVRHDKYSSPIYYGYYGFDKYFFYTWLWARQLYKNNLYCNNLYLVDEVGQDILFVGAEGFYAGDTNTLNVNAPFEPLNTGDIVYYYDHEYHESLEDVSILDISDGEKPFEDWEEDKNKNNSSLKGSCSACGSCSSD